VSPAAITRDSVVRASSNQVSSTVEGEAVILEVDDGAYYGLDPVGTMIWQLIQEPIRVGDVCDAIVEEYDVTPERCEADVLELLGALDEVGLLEVGG
jgi:hypothetical protein